MRPASISLAAHKAAYAVKLEGLGFYGSTAESHALPVFLEMR